MVNLLCAKCCAVIFALKVLWNKALGSTLTTKLLKLILYVFVYYPLVDVTLTALIVQPKHVQHHEFQFFSLYVISEIRAFAEIYIIIYRLTPLFKLTIYSTQQKTEV
jgi:hypothetical protein